MLIYHIFPVYLWIYTACFHILAGMSNPSMNRGAQIHIQCNDLVPLGYICSELEPLNHIFNFLQNLYNVFHKDWISLNSDQRYTSVFFSLHPCSTCYLLLFDKSHPNRCQKIFHCHFDMCFPDA